MEKRFDSAARPLGYRDTTPSPSSPGFFPPFERALIIPARRPARENARRAATSRRESRAPADFPVFPRRLLIIRRITGAPIFIACL